MEHYGLDAVVVAVPPAEQFAIGKAALLKGLDVLLEKPATASLAHFDELAAIADARGALLYPVFHAAFGREVEWAQGCWSELLARRGPVTGLHCEFLDPYVENDGVVDCARPLGGSWLDSGSNALSVLGRLLPEFSVGSVRTRRDGGPGHLDVSAVAEVSFSNGAAGPTGTGRIETDRTRGLNRKRSTLFFGESGASLILDHSAQSAVLVEASGEQKVLARLDELPRLTAHYVGVYRDFMQCHAIRRIDRGQARHLLAELLSAQEGRGEDDR